MLSRTRTLVLSITAFALVGCASFDAVGAAVAASDRHDRATEAEFQLDVVVLCSPEGEPHFEPCSGRLELVLASTATDEVGRSRIDGSGAMHGELPVGEYELAIGVDDMLLRLDPVSGVGRAQLHAGQQSLGRLVVHFVELRPGTFVEQASHAGRIGDAYGLRSIDFLHSPARGLLLVAAQLEGPPS